jgi:hypothetical protein
MGSAYTAKFTYYDAGSEGRMCTGSCTCGSPAGTRCNTTVQLLSGACVGGTNPTTLGEGCQQLSNYGAGSVSGSYAQAVDGGSCSPISTETPSGGILPQNPLTVCCLP